MKSVTNATRNKGGQKMQKKKRFFTFHAEEANIVLRFYQSVPTSLSTSRPPLPPPQKNEVNATQFLISGSKL